MITNTKGIRQPVASASMLASRLNRLARNASRNLQAANVLAETVTSPVAVTLGAVTDLDASLVVHVTDAVSALARATATADIAERASMAVTPSMHATDNGLARYPVGMHNPVADTVSAALADTAKAQRQAANRAEKVRKAAYTASATLDVSIAQRANRKVMPSSALRNTMQGFKTCGNVSQASKYTLKPSVIWTETTVTAFRMPSGATEKVVTARDYPETVDYSLHGNGVSTAKGITAMMDSDRGRLNAGNRIRRGKAPSKASEAIGLLD